MWYDKKIQIPIHIWGDVCPVFNFFKSNLKICFLVNWSSHNTNLALNLKNLSKGFVSLALKLQARYTAWKVSKYRVFSGTYFPVFELNTEYGPEKTPYLGTFHAVILRTSVIQIYGNRSPKQKVLGSECNSTKCEFFVLQWYRQSYIIYVPSKKTFIETGMINYVFLDSS